MENNFCDKNMSLREIIKEIDPFQEMRLLERVELAMLLAAATQDVSVGTMGMCLDAEQDIDFPLTEQFGETVIDTEVVYHIVDEVAKTIVEERYGN